MRILTCLILSLISLTLYAKPQCIAHRGFTENHPENSFSAIMAAVDQQADGVEFDVQHTQDGVALVMHDETLARTVQSKAGRACKLTQLIKELSLKEIRENCELIGDGEIPTLEAVLRYLEDKNLYTFVELKDKPNLRTLKLIERYNSQKPELLRLISFKSKSLKVAKKLKKKNAFWKDVRLMRVYKVFPLNLSSYDIDIYYKTKFMAWLPRLLGKEVGVWTVDEEADLAKIMKTKISYITTNKLMTCLKLK
ncbi:hypothetical protein A9Q84_06995 [Halobacteriovorax marinus]|uniref:GP-PDE domain-containing protein n=1 Tax=Halobacteriovorax marinus TaxID=97084 RepID=A0A1Y5FGI0_9BACT|nr:hypothetical protein A9Q84_06995 [Halobacteriovorax marinus]